MSHGLRAGLLTTALLVLAVTSACSGTPDESRTSPTPTVSESPASTSPSPSPSPSPISETEVAEANAQAVLRDFYRVTDELSSDPSRPLTDLGTVATSLVLDAWTRDFEQARRDELRQSGATRLIKVELVDVSLDNSDPQHGRVPSVRFEVCWDVSDVEIKRNDGASALPAERPARGWERIIVANYSWDTDPDGGWRVASGETLEREPCESA